MLTLFLLVLCGVSEDATVAEHALTADRLLLPDARNLGRADDKAAIEALARRAGSSDVQDAMWRALHETDVPPGLASRGLTRQAVEQIRHRLLAS